MNKLCSWCKKIIDPTRHPYVRIPVRLPNGGSFEYRYHAGKLNCYQARREFERIHAFLPLVPETHDHE